MSVTTRTFDCIRHMIGSGELQPGERLPPEQELADHLGVSRGSLREAVKALAAINVLDVRRGDGTYVTNLEPAELLTGLVFAMELLQVRGLDEVLEVRQVVLPATMALACQRITADELDHLRSILVELDATTDPDRAIELHRRFYAEVFAATRNETLNAMLRALRLRGKNVRRRTWLGSSEETRRSEIVYLKDLLRAFERGDAELARSLATVEVAHRQSWIQQLSDETHAAAVDTAAGHDPGYGPGPSPAPNNN